MVAYTYSKVRFWSIFLKERRALKGMYCREFLNTEWLLSSSMECLSISERLKITRAPKPFATIFRRRLFPILGPGPRSKWAGTAGLEKLAVLLPREAYTTENSNSGRLSIRVKP